MSNTIMYNVKNRSAGVATYKIPEMGVRRTFSPGETKQISAEELEKLTYRPGGMALLANFLQIIEPEAIAKVGLRPEPEYNMSEQDIINLMKNGSIDEFLDCLDFAPDGVIDLVKNLAVTLKLNDYTKREAILEKTGFDVTKAIEINKETEEIKQEKTNTTRRVKEETQEVSEKPVRRTLSSTKK